MHQLQIFITRSSKCCLAGAARSQAILVGGESGAALFGRLRLRILQ